LKLTDDDDSLSTAVKKVGEELKDLRAAKRCYDVYGLEACGLSDVSKDSSVASVDILEGLPTLVRKPVSHDKPCGFCGYKGHDELQCRIKARMSREVKETPRRKGKKQFKGSRSKGSKGKAVYSENSSGSGVYVSSAETGGFEERISMLPDSGCTEMSIIDAKVVKRIHPRLRPTNYRTELA
ncbi:hypothetical protein ADUPG1_004005, partial [Aduncisulcus paluster]